MVHKPSDRQLMQMATPATVSVSEAAIDRLATTFETSAKLWERVVYPSLFAFIVLAIYGFYLIYSLTTDVSSLARSIDPNMGEHMSRLAQSVDKLASNVDSMSTSISAMDLNMQSMAEGIDDISTKMNTLEPILNNMYAMNQNMAEMAGSTGQMQRDLWSLNESVSSPMRFMNSFMPWRGIGSTTPTWGGRPPSSLSRSHLHSPGLTLGD
jgi:methyl-accepting chemotaxis protein